MERTLTMIHLRESGHPIFRETSALDRGSLKARKEEESYRFTTTVTCRPQSYYSAQLFPSTSSVSTERSRIGAKNSLNRCQIIRFPVRGDPCRI